MTHHHHHQCQPSVRHQQRSIRYILGVSDYNHHSDSPSRVHCLPVMSAPRWQPNEECVQCNNCDVPFSLFVLRHHCRRYTRRTQSNFAVTSSSSSSSLFKVALSILSITRCGRIFCDVCTAARVPLLPLHAQPVRVCAGCFQIAFSQIAAAPAAAACVAAASTMPPFANADVEVLRDLFPVTCAFFLSFFLFSSLNLVARLLNWEFGFVLLLISRLTSTCCRQFWLRAISPWPWQFAC